MTFVFSSSDLSHKDENGFNQTKLFPTDRMGPLAHTVFKGDALLGEYKSVE